MSGRLKRSPSRRPPRDSFSVGQRRSSLVHCRSSLGGKRQRPSHSRHTSGSNGRRATIKKSYPNKPRVGPVQIIVACDPLKEGAHGCYFQSHDTEWLHDLTTPFTLAKVDRKSETLLTDSEIKEWQAWMKGMGVKILKPGRSANHWMDDLEQNVLAYSALGERYSTLRPFKGYMAFRLKCPKGMTIKMSYDKNKTTEITDTMLFPQLGCTVDMAHLRERNINFDMNEFKAVYTNLREAVKLLHKKGLIHRDIKPQNVVYCKDQSPKHQIKLIDFGLLVKDTKSGCSGTAYYCTKYYKSEMRATDDSSWAADYIEDLIKKWKDQPLEKGLLSTIIKKWKKKHDDALDSVVHRDDVLKLRHQLNDCYGILCTLLYIVAKHVDKNTTLKMLEDIKNWVVTLIPPLF